MTNKINFQSIKFWWDQFPFELKLITKIRFFAAFGAGGVIYLTSLTFYNIGLSGTDIGFGFALSAVVGTLTRFITGNYLNKRSKIQLPLIISSLLSIVASILLIISKDTFLYVIGQTIIGGAAGIYWPTVEYAVPHLSGKVKRIKAYALVRSSEAFGIFLGVLTGSFLNSIYYFKSIYINDILCMFIIINLLIKNNYIFKGSLNKLKTNIIDSQEIKVAYWHKYTNLIIASLILITSCLALFQVSLPLDFVNGGLYRKPVNEELTRYIISSQLILLFILQWPLGLWISKKGRLFGLKISLLSFGFSTLLLFISNFFETLGVYLMLISIIFGSIGTASFLPASTDIVLKIAPFNKKGYALALLSQCFALGYIGPLIAEKIIDIQGDASIIWLTFSQICFFLFISIFKKKF